MSVKAVRELSAEVPADDFHALEEKVYRTIDLYKGAREARFTAERDLARLRQQLEQRDEELEQLRRDMIALRREREQVRERVEKMLHHIEAMTAEEAAG